MRRGRGCGRRCCRLRFGLLCGLGFLVSGWLEVGRDGIGGGCVWIGRGCGLEERGRCCNYCQVKHVLFFSFADSSGCSFRDKESIIGIGDLRLKNYVRAESDRWVEKVEKLTVHMAPELDVVFLGLAVELRKALVAADAQVGEEDAVGAKPARRECLIEVVLLAPSPVGEAHIPG